ncbi:MAG: 3-phosphoshikimate 1-carboxyvinyltransferase [Thermoleophilia bacterium]
MTGGSGSILFEPAKAGLRGTVIVPADKSISHRAAMIAAISDRPVRIKNFLQAADTLSTLHALQVCGVESTEEAGAGSIAASEQPNGVMVIEGMGLRGFHRPKGMLDAGNSGTTMRLLPGILCGQDHHSYKLDGDLSLRLRPMDRIVNPLRSMGVDIKASQGRFAPLVVNAGKVHGIEYEMPVASAQVKSALLLAGLFSESPVRVTEPSVCRDHTERMLAAAGADIEKKGLTTIIKPASRLQLDDLAIPGDLSSAAFFIVAACVIPGSEIILPDVGINPTRTGLIDILKEMGADIIIENAYEAGGEPVADLRVRSSALRAVRAGADISGRAIDELPLLALAGAFAEGDTVVSGAAELKVKESDRIAGLVENMSLIGVDIKATPDGFIVHGGNGVEGGISRFKSFGDHRLAMLGAIAGLASRSGVVVQGFESVSVSYPLFAVDLRLLAGGLP